MEENKRENPQETPSASGSTQRKATYEELNGWCAQLLQQNRQLAARLRQAETEGLFRRLDCLFRVVENPGCFGHGFVTACAGEIEAALTPREETLSGGASGKEAE